MHATISIHFRFFPILYLYNVWLGPIPPLWSLHNLRDSTQSGSQTMHGSTTTHRLDYKDILYMLILLYGSTKRNSLKSKHTGSNPFGSPNEAMWLFKIHFMISLICLKKKKLKHISYFSTIILVFTLLYASTRMRGQRYGDTYSE